MYIIALAWREKSCRGTCAAAGPRALRGHALGVLLLTAVGGDEGKVKQRPIQRVKPPRLPPRAVRHRVLAHRVAAYGMQAGALPNLSNAF